MSSQDRPVSFKKERNKKTQTSYSEPALSESSFKSETQSSWPYALAVAIITLISFWIRTLPSASVFLAKWGCKVYELMMPGTICVLCILFLLTTLKGFFTIL